MLVKSWLATGEGRDKSRGKTHRCQLAADILQQRLLFLQHGIERKPEA